MLSSEETLAIMRRGLEMAIEGVLTQARGVLEEAEQQRAQGRAELAEEQARWHAEMAEEQARWHAEMNAGRAQESEEMEPVKVVAEPEHVKVYAPDQAAAPSGDVAYAMGGSQTGFRTKSSMERRDAATGKWSAVADMGTARYDFGSCKVFDVVHVMGGYNDNDRLSSAECYNAKTDSWTDVASMPEARSGHAAVAVGSAMYVLGGCDNTELLELCSAHARHEKEFRSMQGRQRHLCFRRL
jgi:hypothetical protein